jgi:hypothetical protein
MQQIVACTQAALHACQPQHRRLRSAAIARAATDLLGLLCGNLLGSALLLLKRLPEQCRRQRNGRRPQLAEDGGGRL